jgi:CxxC motif-containing protein
MATKTVEITCIQCPLGCDIELEVDDETQEILKINGAGCPAGEDYAKEEYRNPTRILPTTARVSGGVLPLVPVKSAGPLPKGELENAMREIAKVELQAPVELGDVVVENVCDTGVDIVATRDLPAERQGPKAASD